VTTVNLAFWNIRGLNGPKMQVVVGSFLHNNKCALLGLSETKTKYGKDVEICPTMCPDPAVLTN